MSEKEKDRQDSFAADAAVEAGGCLVFESLGCALSAFAIMLVPVLVMLT